MKSQRTLWKWTSIAMLLIVAFVVAACGGGAEPTASPAPAAEAVGQVASPAAPQGQPPAVGAAATPVPPTPTPRPEPTATPTPEPEPTLAPGALGSWISNVLSGEIKSYRGRTEIRSSDGQEIDVEIASVREPMAYRATMKMKDDPDEMAGFGNIEMILVDETMYLRTRDSEEVEWEDWLAIGASMADITPEEFFFGLLNPLAEWDTSQVRVVSRSERVNGIDTTHYRVTDKGIAELLDTARLATGGIDDVEDTFTATDASADLWVARQGNYLVKSVVRIDGTEEGQPAWMEVTSEILSVNEPIVIRPPEGVAKPGLPDDVPVFPGAQMQGSFGKMATFLISDATVKDVADFYKREMPANGWQAAEGAFETDDMSMLGFTKAGQSCQVMISKDNEKISLTVMIE